VSGICIENGAKWHFSAQILRARDRIAKFVCRSSLYSTWIRNACDPFDCEVVAYSPGCFPWATILRIQIQFWRGKVQYNLTLTGNK